MTNGKYYSETITSNSYTVTGLTAGKTYNFIIRVYYKTTVSNWSDPVSGTPKLGIPSVTSITPGDKQLTFNYTTSGNPKEVEIYIVNLKKSVKSSNLTTTTLTGLTNGTKYSFMVRSCFSNGKYSAWSDIKSGVPAKPVSSYVPCSGKMGQATSGNDGSKNGKGDNNGNEVKVSNFTYSSKASSCYHWDVVVRFKDPAMATKAGNIMEAACKNDYIGYDNKSKSTSLSFYNEAIKVNWDVSKINKACYTACSQMVLACAYGAGVPISNTWKNAKGAYNTLVSYGSYFNFYYSTDYTSNYKNLKRGDILISYKSGAHHAAMAL